MIRFILLLFFLTLTISTASAAHWHQLPVSFNYEFTGLHFIDENKGFLVSREGFLVSLDLSGETPKTDTFSFSSNLNDIYFHPDGKNGFAVGSDGLILRSSDSGRSWETSKRDPDMRLTAISFIDSLHGVLVGANYSKTFIDIGFILLTSDGGATWDSLDIIGRKIRYIDIAPDGLISVTGLRSVFLSENRGSTWDEADILSGKIPMAAAVRGNNGILVGGSGLLAVSSDRGRNWEFVESLIDTATYFDILMLDSLRAFIVGTDGDILYTRDAGRNWVPEASSVGNDLYALQKIGKRIFACGKRGVIIYSDIEE
ncbi:MAG: YCF48-related protein [Candidatus Zixiibacteriota bacterium]